MGNKILVFFLSSFGAQQYRLAKKSNVRLIMKWIANRQIGKGEEIRKISSIIKDKKKLTRMKNGKKLREVLLMTTKKPSEKFHEIIHTKNQVNQDKKYATQVSLNHFFDIANETIMRSNQLVLDKKNINRLRILRKEIDRLIEENKKY